MKIPGKLKDKKIVLAGVGGAVAFASAGAFAATVIGSPTDEVISACIDKQGRVRIPGSAGCDSSEAPLSWNRLGPTGPIGPAGPQGIAGPAGADGAPGATGAPGAAGAQGPQGIQGATGLQGPMGLMGPQGPAGPAGASCAGGGSGTGGTTVEDNIHIFLKIDGIQGESTSSKHKNEIEVESFSWGASNSGTTAYGSGAGAGKASFRDLTVSKHLDKASPKLMDATATGEHITTALLTIENAQGTQVAQIKLTNVLIKSIDSSRQTSDSREFVGEEVALNFAKVEFNYTPTDPDGTAGSAESFAYDIALQKSL